MVKLPPIEEPVELKREFALGLKDSNKNKRKITEATIRQGTWFTTEYYRRYKNILRAQGIKWQILMEAFSMSGIWFIKWAKGDITWEEALKHLEDSVNSLLMPRYRSGNSRGLHQSTASNDYHVH